VVGELVDHFGLDGYLTMGQDWGGPISMAVDTATPTGRAVAAIMATLAELELELGRERRAASREARRARNLPATKPPKLTPERQEQLRRLAATGEPVRELAAAFGIGRATAYRYLMGESGTGFCPEGQLLAAQCICSQVD
jgi:pimeloyl-ACP methyl ester carboxylesterase